MSTETKELTIQERVDQLVAEVSALTIENNEQKDTAGEALLKCQRLTKAVKAYFEPERAATHLAYKIVTNTIKKYVDALGKGERAVKQLLADYRQKQEQDRRQEQRRLEDEARKREEERKLQDAIDSGDDELVDEILDEPIVAPPPMAAPIEATDGISYVDHWDFEILDPKQVPREYLVVDEKKVRGVVKATKGSVQIPGVRIFCEKRVRGRA